LANPPEPLGRNGIARVNAPLSEAELAAVRQSVQKGRPLGSERWSKRVTEQLDLHHTFRPRGRREKNDSRPL
jgi:putative transposase